MQIDDESRHPYGGQSWVDLRDLRRISQSKRIVPTPQDNATALTDKDLQFGLGLINPNPAEAEKK